MLHLAYAAKKWRKNYRFYHCFQDEDGMKHLKSFLAAFAYFFGPQGLVSICLNGADEIEMIAYLILYVCIIMHIFQAYRDVPIPCIDHGG